MNWNNIDLESVYERDQNILDSIKSKDLLLNISCNVRDITSETVQAEFNIALESAVDSAIDVFAANLENFVKKAKQERNQN
jgi:hypothetical protein